MFAANVSFVSLFLLAPTLWGAGTATTTTNPSLTVLMEFEAPHSEASLSYLRQSLNQLLKPGGYNVDVQLKSETSPNAQFGQLVVFKMKGSCSLDPAVPSHTVINERGPLALAYTSDGQVLHFGEVECDRVRQTLQRIVGLSASLKNQRTYGSALAIVIAHEVYHMLGNVIDHTHTGLTKPALSADELASSKLSLPPNAIATIRKYVHFDTATALH
jgi:hypothetical protein